MEEPNYTTLTHKHKHGLTTTRREKEKGLVLEDERLGEEGKNVVPPNVAGFMVFLEGYMCFPLF